MIYSCKSIECIHSKTKHNCAYLEIHCVKFFGLISNDKRNSMRKNLFGVVSRMGPVAVGCGGIDAPP